ncbi:hypothetical protein EYD10_12088 [Varanus komodoensis]|nr:hypothetical protein EYD10_12088 [Varanus komodoensis]
MAKGEGAAEDEVAGWGPWGGGCGLGELRGMVEDRDSGGKQEDMERQTETQGPGSPEETQRMDNEYRIKPVEEVKYMKNGGEDDQKVAARNQENLNPVTALAEQSERDWPTPALATCPPVEENPPPSWLIAPYATHARELSSLQHHPADGPQHPCAGK